MPAGSTRSDTLNFRSGGMAAGAMTSDRKDAEAYGTIHADRMAADRAVPDSVRAWIALRTIADDVRHLTLGGDHRPSTPLPSRERRCLQRAADRARILIPRLAHETDRAAWNSWLAECDQVLST